MYFQCVWKNLQFFIVARKILGLINNKLVDHLEKYSSCLIPVYGFKSSRSSADILTIVADRIDRVFKMSDVNQAGALEISKASDRVWNDSLL